jgi:hypothetical protein
MDFPHCSDCLQQENIAFFLTVLNLIQHLIFYSADNGMGHFTTIVNTI